MKRKIGRGIATILALLGLTACGGGTGQQGTGEGGSLSGSITIDGSSTVAPITEAMAEEFQKQQKQVQIAIGVSGTGGGFKKFCGGETDISNASRPIKPEEMQKCQENGIEFVELPVAYDAISVVVNPQNDWVSCLKVEELKKIWEPEAQGKITKWKQVNDKFPDEPLNLYGPGTDSGTFDYFTEAIVGEADKSRGDYTASEDDNVIVQGVANDKGALGYFGLAYLEENIDKVKPVAIDDGDPKNGEGCIEPNVTTVEDGTYQPLSRPLFIYVKKESLNRPEVKAFVEFYLQKENKPLVNKVGYVHLPDTVYDKVQARFKEQKTGTVFTKGSAKGVKLESVL